MASRPDRRRVLAGAAAALGVSGWRSPAFAGETAGEADYRRAVIIDALGEIPDPAAPAGLEGPPSAALLSDLRTSGLTAVSVTLGLGASGDPLANVVRKIAAYDEKVAAAPDRLQRVIQAGDIARAKASGRLGLIYNVQDGSVLNGDLGRVSLLKALGLRVMQLTYNPRNIIGDGCLEPGNAGLSVFGSAVVEELGRQRLVMDLSHGGQRTTAEAIRLATRPPVISHSGCRALVDFPRNTADAELRALADKGGVAGIYLMPFLSPAGAVTPGDLFRHLEHAVNVCGEDHVGLGTDGAVSAAPITEDTWRRQRAFYEARAAQGVAAPGEGPDRLNLIAAYNEPARFLRIAGDLSRRGWPERRIEKILGANFLRVFDEVWGGSA